MSETMTAPSIPENALPPEPEYILKKKFCFASIPAMFATGISFFVAVLMIIIYVEKIIEDIGGSWTNILYDVVYLVQFTTYFVAMALLCVFAFVKLNKPFACIPPFMLALSILPQLVIGIFNCYNSEEFEETFASGIYDHYSYTDYMIINICGWAYTAMLVLSFVAFGVYLIIASRKKAGNGVKKLWFIPVIISAISVAVCIVSYGVNFALCYVGLYTEIWEAILSPLIGLLTESVVYISQFVAFAFFCKWMANPYKKVLKKVEEPEIPVLEETTVDTEKVEEKAGEKAEEKAEEEQKPAEPIVARSAPVAPPKPVEPKPQPVAPPPVMNQAPVRPVMPPPAMRQPPVRPVAPPPVNVFVPSNQETTMAQKNNIELIKQYKELLDMGAITQEEYDEKKKELLANN